MYKNNDLQRAIDEITQNNLASKGAGEVAAEPTVENVMPPMPAATMQGIMNGVVESEMPKIELDVAAEPTTQPAMVVDEPVEAPVSAPAKVDADVAEIKAAAMKELFPLIDRVEMDAQKRFDLCRKMYETLKDKAVLAQALEAARKIVDEKNRAEALFYLVDAVDE